MAVRQSHGSPGVQIRGFCGFMDVIWMLIPQTTDLINPICPAGPSDTQPRAKPCPDTSA